jgi:glycerophosphoryl diester phosphodiesterase
MSIKYAMLLILPLITSCQTNSNPLIIGHRGARGHVAENTLPSIEKAMALGVDGVEIDIFKCASGELVVFHDQTLDHLTNASGLIEMQTLDSLRKIDVLNGYQIPTLAEVLELLDGQIILNIELKGNNTARDTHLLLTEYFQRSNWTADKLIISSFNWDELRNFKALNPTVPLAVLTEDDPVDALPVAQELGAVAINPNYQSLDREKVEKIKKAGFKIYPWTVNTPAAIAEMKQLGVDAIITDYPERVRQ